jgi:hypothetical protein
MATPVTNSSRLIGSTGSDFISSLIPDGNCGFIVAGNTGGSIGGQTSSGSEDGFIARYDSNGNNSWTQHGALLDSIN